MVACTVSWFLRTTPPVGATSHLPAQEIKVYIPATMSILYGTPENPGPADRAIADWNVALAGTGVTFKMVPQSCGSGADCVSFAEGTVAQGCAQVEAGSSSPDGTANAASTVRLPSAFRTRTPERNRRTVAHELGHLLGLTTHAPARTASWALLRAMRRRVLLSPRRQRTRFRRRARRTETMCRKSAPHPECK